MQKEREHTEKYTWSFKPIDVDPDLLYDRIRHRIIYGPVRKVGVSRFWKYGTIAASFALLVILAFLFYPHGRMPAEQLSYMEVTGIPGTRTRIILPDNTQVWLHDASTITYPYRFTDSRREVTFSGEAFFDVQKDEHHPFIVQTEGMKLEVTGTSFNIRTDGEELIETTLLTGEVALYGDSNTSGAPDVVLEPGQQVLFHKKENKAQVKQVNTDHYISWLTREFYFDDLPLQEVVRVLERASRIPVIIENESLKELKLNAKFTHQESLEEILSVLRISARYTIIKKEGGIYLR